MKRKIFVSIMSIFLMCVSAKAVISIEEREWAKNEFFLNFLQNNSLPLALYYDLDAQDKELASEIKEGTKFQILWNENSTIEQVLIPIDGSDLQIHIYKNLQGEYTLVYTPVIFIKQTRFLNINVQNSVYQDVEQASGSSPLARAVRNAFSGSVNFKAVQKGDNIQILYERKERMGRRFGDIVIKMVKVEVNKKPNEAFFYNDVYFNRNGKEVEKFLLTTPVKYKRISSYFTKARYHPILKRYRAHLGVDYAAPTGTPVVSAGDGVILFVGTKGGYGKVVEIQHASGYKSLYAHLSRFAKIKKGQKVKQGQLIAYVGSTGLSTGPHLHFGIYEGNNAINPLSVVKISKSQLSKKEKEKFDKVVASYEQEFQSLSLINDMQKEPPSFENYIDF